MGMEIDAWLKQMDEHNVVEDHHPVDEDVVAHASPQGTERGCRHFRGSG